MNVFLADDRPGGSESPHLENLTTNSGSFPSLASYPATTTYYTTPATYFSNDIPTHHGLQPVRLPSIASSLSGVSDLGTIKEHPAAGQVDQMNSYMEYFVEGDSQVVHDGTVAEEVVVDDVVHYESQHGIEDNLMEDTLVEDQGLPTVSYAHMSDDSSSPMIYRKKQHKPLDMMRNGMSPEEDVGKNEVVRQKRAEAARTRYQRMSEQERKVYNQKRRLKALGIDPNSNDPHITEQIKETIKRANAKKAEAARQRYHNMTPDEKREYNQRRTQSFRRRREEEEILLSTPAGAISADALQKAQQIMIRNARKAESARARYQKMTPDQRKEYNIRRAACKKSRNKMLREASISGSDVNNESMSDPASISLNSSFTEPPPMLEPPPPEIEQQSYILPPKPKDPRDEILLQMEKEVLKRTNRAKQILDKQQKTSQEPPSREQRYPDMHHEQMIMNDTPDRPYTSQNQLMIDEKALHDMLVTGRDANGMAVELRTVDGIKITDESQLREVAQGQTIVIQPCEPGIIIESKDNMYVQTPEGQLLLTQGTSSQGYGQYRTGYSSGIEDPSMMSLAERHAAAKAKRAERARIRYRNMQPELRQAQNAKRADLLRKSRARDEELVQMAESRDVGTLTPDVQRAIQDAKERRRKRAEQARSKYHRMSSEERRQYNAMRDAQRRQRKRVQEMEKGTLDHDDRSNINHHRNGPSDSMTPPEQLEERIIYNGFEMYDDNWDQ